MLDILEEDALRLLQEQQEMEEVKRRKAKDALKMASWHQPDWVEGKENSKETEKLYNIDSELQHISQSDTSITFIISDVNNTAEIAERMAILQKCLPSDVEIGIRINTRGKAEVYADGNIDYKDFRKKESALLGLGGEVQSNPISCSPVLEDYTHAKTHLSPEEQRVFIENTTIASEQVQNLDSGLDNINAIRGALQTEKAKEILTEAGARPIADDEIVPTAAAKPQQQIQKQMM